MREIKELRQPTPSTCVHTCIAMLAGVSVKQVIKDAEEMFGDCRPNGMRMRDEYAMLLKYKVDFVPLMFPQLRFPNFYIATVPSLNKVGINHRVLIDMTWNEERGEYNQNVYDPNKGTGRKFYVYHKSDKSRSKGEYLRGYSELIQIYGIRGK